MKTGQKRHMISTFQLVDDLLFLLPRPLHIARVFLFCFVSLFFLNQAVGGENINLKVSEQDFRNKLMTS